MSAIAYNRGAHIACEGGHSLYTPRTALEREVKRALAPNDEPVSIEMICGGVNLAKLEAAMAQAHGRPVTQTGPAEIIAKGIQGDPFFRDLCQVRANALITGTANMALVTGAQGGVVLAGGVTRHLLPFINQPETLDLFNSVWPDGDFLQKIAIRMLINPLAPLIGAASHYLHNDNA